MFDIFNIEPHTISRSIIGKNFLFYGEKKCGKTSTAVKFPKSLILGFEYGWSGLNGVKAIPISDWVTFKRQIVQPLIKEAEEVRKGLKETTTYSTLIVDTCDLAYDLCSKYILSVEGVSNHDESTNMRSYKKCEKEFETVFLDLMRQTDANGNNLYSIVFISHEEVKQQKNILTKEKEIFVSTTMDKRAHKVISRAVDCTIYMKTIDNNDGNPPQRYAFFRTDGTFEAGSRYTYLPPYVPLTYANIEQAVLDAVEKQCEEDGIVAEAGTKSIIANEVSYDFDSLMDEARSLFTVFETNGQAQVFANVVESILGIGSRLSEVKPHQVIAVADIVAELKNKATELGLI